MREVTDQQRDTWRRQGEALLPAIAYGDAAGLPVENRIAQEIEQQFGRIKELLPAKHHLYFQSEEQPGIVSDDTQQSIAVAKALIRANGFDLDAMAEAHIEAYEATQDVMHKTGEKTIKRGWGASTIGAMEKLRSGVSPHDSGTVDGAGNGVLIKMAPLVLWQSIQQVPMEERYEQYDQLTNMTHNSSIARMSTRILGDLLSYSIRDTYNKSVLMNVLEGAMVTHEFDAQRTTDIELGYMRDFMEYLYGNVNRKTILANTGEGFYAPETIARVLGAYVAHDGVFTPSVYEAVNLGGDTDSIASIVAAMSVFNANGEVQLPEDAEVIEGLPELRSIGRQLGAFALQAA